MAGGEKLHYCSFCGSSQNEVPVIIRDPINTNAAICSNCNSAVTEQVELYLKGKPPKDYPVPMGERRPQAIPSGGLFLITYFVIGSIGFILGSLITRLVCA